MTDASRIYLAGHRGLVGGAIRRALDRASLPEPMVKTRAELDLSDRAAVHRYLERERPEWVFVAAARVGGILANQQFGADFIRENLEIQTNLIDGAYRAGVRKLLFLGSSCVYPRDAVQPMREDCLLTGPLEASNKPYAVAKIAGIAMCDAYRAQYGLDAFTVMPSNVYGIGDNFSPEASHLVAGMMRRFHEARRNGSTEVVVWGTGQPRRELVFADDLGDACVHLMRTWTEGGIVNAGSGDEISVKDLAALIGEVVGFKGSIRFDPTKPDGTPRKIMDNTKLESSGFRTGTPLREGLSKMYDWYRSAQIEPGGARAQ